jgi:hypothetical protein
MGGGGRHHGEEDEHCAHQHRLVRLVDSVP